ncbi:MAG: CARDB domain-containing protein [bacterium]|nr:CARDB domain-containing protein [bacterium]
MKTLTFIVILILTFSTGISYSQTNLPKSKGPGSHLKGRTMIDRQTMLNNISRNTKSFVKDAMGNWYLSENFEGGIFPPNNWSLGVGNTTWDVANVSAYGSGNFSMFYSNWYCDYSNNYIITPGFGPSVAGDKLRFDYAYAPYYDGNTYVDDLEIFYYDDVDQAYYSLVFYTGVDLQTSPATGNYFVPNNNEWGTKTIDLPPNATFVYFQSLENCGNNIYIDNVKIGVPLNGPADASVEKVWAKGKVAISYGTPDTISTLIKNTGGADISNLKVYLNVTGTNNFIDSTEISFLAIGDTTQVNFRGFTPVLNGFSDVTVTIPADDNNSNNSGTYLTQANSTTQRYTDSNCCNAAVGWIGELSFVNKYRMSGTGQVRKINIKLSDGDINVGQIVYGIVVDANGVVAGKSPHYKIQAGDLGKFKSFDITDPKPTTFTNTYYYVGIAQTQFSGDGFAFTPQQFFSDAPARPNANYGTYLGPVGSTVLYFEFPREYGQNYAIESVIGLQVSTDAGISDLGLTYEQFFSTSTFTPVGRVFNAGTSSSTFNVRRTITPGGYTSTKTVTSLAAGSNTSVTFDPWTFTPNTTYSVRDSILSSDGNTSNNSMTSSITPRIAKQLCVLWQQQGDRDSLVRSIIADGRYANNFDTVRMNYTGSYRPWKIMFAEFKEEGSYMPWVRDSMKSFLDNSTAGNKKTLVVFGDNIAVPNDPDFGGPSPSDTIFLRQYLKTRTISDNWMGSIPASENKFRGTGFFDGITQDSVSDPYTPELIRPVNGGSAAFKPQSVTGNNADSCNAVSYAGPSYNSFFMTNLFSSLRASSGSQRGPVLVYTKIIDWLTSVNTGVKVLDITLLIEGFYDAGTNVMVGDTVRVYLRNQTNPFAIVDSSKGYLNASGIGSFIFNNAVNGTNYYLHIKHRNGIETWSKTVQSFSSNHLAYNFTTAADKSFGDNLKLAGSKWVMFGGDQNQDGTVDVVDIVNVYNDASNFNSGYVKTDLNGDDFVDVADVLITYNNSSQFVSKVTPLTPPSLLAKKGIVVDNSQKPVLGSPNDSDERTADNEIYERFKNEPKKFTKLPEFKTLNQQGDTQLKNKKVSVNKTNIKINTSNKLAPKVNIK